jgi:hypothetical protein
LLEQYVDQLQSVFGGGSCHRLMIRSTGVTHLDIG